MVVTPNPRDPRNGDDHVSYDEERTYREAIKTVRAAENEIFDSRLAALNAKVDGLIAQVELRFGQMDRATEGLAENHNRVQPLLDRETGRLAELFDEKLTRVDSIGKEMTRFVSSATQSLTASSAADVLAAREEAQTANNALERLLQTTMASAIRLAEVRFAAQETAIAKTETAIATALAGAQAAISAARSSAAAALSEVDQKSEMRHTAALAAVGSSEHQVGERLLALQQLIDLRARMNEDAVAKANEATDKRFDSVNEFRAQLADQTRNFVTLPVLDARFSQVSIQTETLDRQLRTDTQSMRDTIGQLSIRISARETADLTKREVRTDGHLTVGSVVGIVGGVVGMLMFIAAIGFGFVGMHHPDALAVNPTVGADTKRVDDLVSRLNELTARLNPPSPLVPAK